MTLSTKGVPELGPLEFALVRILWRIGPAAARDVLNRYNERSKKPLAYTTVMTLLTRLVDKGVLAADRDRQPFRFSTRINREQLLKQRVQDFVELFFEGSAVDLAVRLVEETPLTQESLQKLERILERSRSEMGGQPSDQEKEAGE